MISSGAKMPFTVSPERARQRPAPLCAGAFRLERPDPAGFAWSARLNLADAMVHLCRMTKTSRILGWLLLAAIVFGTLAPIGYRPISSAPVSLERFGAYAAVSFLLVLGYPGRRWPILGLIIVAAGALETLQLLELTRHGRFGDFAVKIAGCGFGALVAAVVAFIPASMTKAEGRH